MSAQSYISFRIICDERPVIDQFAYFICDERPVIDQFSYFICDERPVIDQFAYFICDERPVIDQFSYFICDERPVIDPYSHFFTPSWTICYHRFERSRFSRCSYVNVTFRCSPLSLIRSCLMHNTRAYVTCVVYRIWGRFSTCIM